VKVSSAVSAVSAARRLLHPVSDIKERQSGPVPVRKAQEWEEVYYQSFLASALRK